MKKNNYYIIGGQYYFYCYGGCPTLLGAKRLARKNEEYWDNWQGWHTPAIFKAEDCEEVDTDRGMRIIPKLSSTAFATYDRYEKRWIEG
jgi:hypothetical protein